MFPAGLYFDELRKIEVADQCTAGPSLLLDNVGSVRANGEQVSPPNVGEDGPRRSQGPRFTAEQENTKGNKIRT